MSDIVEDNQESLEKDILEAVEDIKEEPVKNEKEDNNDNHIEKDKKEDKVTKDKKSIFKKKDDLEKKKLEEENKILNEKLLRVSAEMQNMKRRNEEKVANLLKYEGEDLIKKLLPVIDNFERAINQDESKLPQEVVNYLNGFKMIYSNLASTFASYEIEEIDCKDKPFDPNTMEAVMVEEKEGVEPDMVIDVLQKGYTYKGKVIRYAMVKVSK